MNRYRQVTRYLFAVIFISGGISHFVLGRTMPDGYGAFGNTALIPGLGDLWTSFVMPNIGWLTIVTGTFEIACGVGLLLERYVRISAAAIIGFLVFITVLGYGFPAENFFNDLTSNRLITMAMALLVLPLVLIGAPYKSTMRDRTVTMHE